MDAGVAVRASLQMLLDKVPWRETWAVPGKHGLFQAVLFAGGPKGPSKKPTEMMP